MRGAKPPYFGDEVCQIVLSELEVIFCDGVSMTTLDSKQGVFC